MVEPPVHTISIGSSPMSCRALIVRIWRGLRQMDSIYSAGVCLCASVVGNDATVNWYNRSTETLNWWLCNLNPIMSITTQSMKEREKYTRSGHGHIIWMIQKNESDYCAMSCTSRWRFRSDFGKIIHDCEKNRARRSIRTLFHSTVIVPTSLEVGTRTVSVECKFISSTPSQCLSVSPGTHLVVFVCEIQFQQTCAAHHSSITVSRGEKAVNCKTIIYISR